MEQVTEVTTWGSGRRAPAARDHREFGGGAPNPTEIFPVFFFK